MAIKQLDEAQKLALRNRAKDELVRLQKLVSEKETKRMIDNFKEKFAICEIVYKVVLEDHQYNKTGKHLDYLKVDMTQAPHALKYAGYDFDKVLLNKLFGAENKVGIRSVKKLRDSLTHSMNAKAVEELTNRESELHGYMDSFLTKINTFDAA
ncbi:MAG TPA: hypothetical protein VFD28_02290 [Candidatus Eisenbacteria bacterium]|nr:hypothetical protein [Candidatus Eisenbacteria bacterium]